MEEAVSGSTIRRRPRKRVLSNLGSWVPGGSKVPSSPRDLVADFVRASGHLTREQAARAAGVSVATLRKWESGLFRNVGTHAKRKVVVYLAKQAIAGAA